MPEEIFRQIFLSLPQHSLLAGVGHTCRRWRKMAMAVWLESGGTDPARLQMKITPEKKMHLEDSTWSLAVWGDSLCLGRNGVVHIWSGTDKLSRSFQLPEYFAKHRVTALIVWDDMLFCVAGEFFSTGACSAFEIFVCCVCYEWCKLFFFFV